MSFRNSDPIIKHFLEEVTSHFGRNLKNVIFFGSRARGEGVTGSDYDFLLVLNEVTSQHKDTVDTIVGNILLQHHAVFSVFPIPEKKFLSHSYDPFFRNVKKEGINLL